MFESAYTLSREKFGGCTKFSLPFLSTIKLITAGRTLSLLIIFVIISFRMLSHFSFHYPGNGYFSGVAVIYHFFHSFALWIKAPTILGKFGNFYRSQIAFQFDGSIQSLGFRGWFFLSIIYLPPLNRKLYYSWSTYFNLTVIINPKSNLSFSNNPRQAYLNIPVLSLSAIASNFSFNESLSPGFSMYYLIVFEKSPMYESKENWYIVSIKEKSLIIKNNFDAILANFL